jgi:hypothetical protein
MKIEKLTLHNFESHKNTEITFESPVSLIVGPLNAGKSSILHAIEYALTGEFDYYRKRTADQNDLIHAGQERMEVILQTDKGTIRRGRSVHAEFLYFNNVTGTVQEIEAIVYRDLRIARGQLIALLNTGNFLEEDVAVQRDLVLKMLDVQISTQFLSEMFDGSAEAFSFFLELYTQPISSVPQLDHAYKTLYDERTRINRELKELVTGTPPEGVEPNVAEIKQKLTTYEKKEKEWIAEVSRLRASSRNTELEMVIKEAKRLETWFDANPYPTKEEATALVDKQTTLFNTIEAAKAEREVIVKELAEADAQVRVSTIHLELLEKFEGKCVAGAHDCPAEKIVMRSAAKEANIFLKAAKKAHSTLSERLGAMKSSGDNDSAMNDIKNRMAAFRRREELWNEKKKDMEDVKARREQAVSKTFETDVEKKILGGEEQIKSLEKKIAYGKDVLEKAQAWVAHRNKVEKDNARRVELEIKSTQIEQLVAFFGPKGVKAALVGKRIAEFEAAINQNLERLGFQVSFSIDPWKVNIRPNPLERALGVSSRSERWRIGVAIQVAMAKFCSINLVVVDNAELLTQQVRFEMIKMLAESGLDQSLIALTLMVPLNTFSPPTLDGVRFFGVQNQSGVSEARML